MSPGLVLPASLEFAQVVRPLAAETSPCFWLIRHQSGGPFGSLLVSQNEGPFDKKRLDLTACHYADWSCWRPHTFPRLAESTRLDEYVFFFAVRRGEAEMSDWVTEYIRIKVGILDYLKREADLFLFYGDGWWEMYSPHAQWRRKFRSAFPKSFERSWRKAGEPPKSTKGSR